MTYFASVAGLPVVSGSLLVPQVGLWTADLQLATGQPVVGPVPVVIGNLELSGHVYRSEPYGGQTMARLVGGFGGWRSTIPPQGYGGGGVPLAHVLQDAATAAGEQMGPVPGGIVGPGFARIEGPASDVLWQMLSQGLIASWHIDPAGVTQVTPWAPKPVTTPFTVTAQKPDEGIVEIATEDYASWMPGATFASPFLTGPFTVAGVVYTFDNEGKFRFQVLTGAQDRVLGPLSQFVDSKLAPTRFYGRYKYLITACTTSTFDGVPVNPLLGLPDIQEQPLTSDSIASYLPVEGGIAHVMFLDGQPTQPICVWTSGPPVTVSIGTAPLPLALGVPTAGGFSAMAAGAATLATLASNVGPWNAALASGAVAAGFAALAAGGTTAAPLVPTTTIKAGP